MFRFKHIFPTLCIFFAFVCGDDSSQYRTIKTKSGSVRGQLKSTFLNRKYYYAFKGIPYGKPPLNELRFKAPEPITSWEPNVIDAFEFGHACIQRKNPDITSTSEDCLNLNVYVPAGIPFVKRASHSVLKI